MINYEVLSENQNPMVLELFEGHLNELDWYYISANPAAIGLLKKNKCYINRWCLSTNPAIFTLDYEKMRKNFEAVEEEILMKVLHPKRIEYYRDTYDYDVDDMFD
jgi:hypothetical protein